MIGLRIKNVFHVLLVLGVFGCATIVSAAAVERYGAAPVTLNCDWESYLGAHDPRWEALPVDEFNAAFNAPIIGTGASGTYLAQDKESGELRFEMSRNDLTDIRRDFNVRKPNGYFRLRFFDGNIAEGRCRLDLFHAEIDADLAVGGSACKVSAFASQNRDVIVFEILQSPGRKNTIDWDFVPDERLPNPQTGFPVVPKEMKRYPSQLRSALDGCEVSVQTLPADAAYRTEHEPAPSQHATAWRVVTNESCVRIFTAVAYSYRASTAAAEAVKRVNQAVATGFDTVREEHRGWWREYYKKSFVSLPAPFERWHWIQLYKIASMTNPDSITDLCGPWYDFNMIWNGIWFNWNNEKMYTSVFTSNHPELADAVLNFLWKHREAIYDKESDGYGAFWGAVSANTGGYHWGSKATDPACLAWLLTLAYERYQVTMDTKDFLEKGVPLMEGAVRYYRKHLLFTGEDGKLHVKATQSPEFRNLEEKGAFEDTTFQIGAIRWLCRTLIAIHARYGTPKTGVDEYVRLLSEITPYCIDPDEGFMIGKDQPFNRAHRHDSHELPIWPYLEYLPSDPAQALVISNTMKTHKQIGFENNGMADTAWALFSAMLGRGDDAGSMLAKNMAGSNMSSKTTRCEQARSGDLLGYCEESPFFVARVTQELLLQGWGDGIIRVFPSVPSAPQWQNIAFHNFRAKGAFLVSAKRTAGVTQFIQVQSLAGEPCSVQTDMTAPLKLISDCGATFADLGKGIVRIDGLGKGHWCLLYSGNELPDLVLPADTPAMVPKVGPVGAGSGATN